MLKLSFDQLMLPMTVAPQSAFNTATLLGSIDESVTLHAGNVAAAHAPPVASRASATKPPCAKRRQDVRERIFII
jgi:hypothetical protein